MASAGRSARREYERRTANDNTHRHERWPLKVALVVGIPVLVYLGIRFLVAQVMPDSESIETLGLTFAALTALALLTYWWGPKHTTQAWRKGSDGEILTERHLQRLPEQFVCLHDRRMPGSRANIDHLVIGPTGIFTVETKNFDAKVEVGRNTVKKKGRSMDAVVTQAAGQATAVQALLGVPVRPLVCIQTGTVSHSMFSKPSLRGVRFCAGRNLVKTIRSYGPELSDDEVSRLAALADRELRPA